MHAHRPPTHAGLVLRAPHPRRALCPPAGQVLRAPLLLAGGFANRATGGAWRRRNACHLPSIQPRPRPT